MKAAAALQRRVWWISISCFIMDLRLLQSDTERKRWEKTRTEAQRASSSFSLSAKDVKRHFKPAFTDQKATFHKTRWYSVGTDAEPKWHLIKWISAASAKIGKLSVICSLSFRMTAVSAVTMVFWWRLWFPWLPFFVKILMRKNDFSFWDAGVSSYKATFN